MKFSCALILTDYHTFFLYISFSACITGIHFRKHEKRILTIANECEKSAKKQGAVTGSGAQKMSPFLHSPFIIFFLLSSPPPPPPPTLNFPHFLLAQARSSLFPCLIDVQAWKMERKRQLRRLYFFTF